MSCGVCSADACFLRIATGPDYETITPRVWIVDRLKLRYRGQAKNHAWLKHRTAAINLRTLLSRGLARQDGTWVLAT